MRELSSIQVEKNLYLNLISNSRLLREGLTTLLAKYLTITQFSSYSSEGKIEAIPLYDGQNVVILDANLGKTVLTEWLKNRSNSAMLFIIIDLADEPELIMEYIEEGICGYTVQGSSAQELARVIKLTQTGQSYCSPEMVSCLFARLADYKQKLNTYATPAIPLTGRELEILQYIAADQSNRAIAAQMSISLCTVKHHVHNILEKLKLRHREDAVRVATEQGWLATPPKETSDLSDNLQ
jgi:DNA-binding NarL/FixJ family response regulator